MAATPEARLLNNLRNYHAEISTLGAEWNPPNIEASAASINNKIIGAQTILDSQDTRRSSTENIENQLKDAIKDIRQTSGGLIRYAKAAGWGANDLAHIGTLNRQIQDTARPAAPALPPPPPNSPPDTPRRRARRTLQAIAAEKDAAYSELIDYTVNKNLKATVTKYNDSTLSAKRDNLRDKINQHAAAIADENDTERDINDLFYLGAGNIVDTAMSGKAYAYADFGRTSQIYRNLAKLIFRKPSRLR